MASSDQPADLFVEALTHTLDGQARDGLVAVRLGRSCECLEGYQPSLGRFAAEHASLFVDGPRDIVNKVRPLHKKRRDQLRNKHVGIRRRELAGLLRFELTIDVVLVQS